MRAPETALLACFLTWGAAVAQAAPIGYSVSYGVLFAIDVGNGVFEEVGPVNFGDPYRRFEALDFGSDGLLYGVAADAYGTHLVTVDPETAETSPIASLAIDNFRVGLAFDARGTLWLSTLDDLYGLDPATGELTWIGSFESPVTSLVARGDALYAATWNGDGRPRIAEVDPETAELTPLFDYEDLFIVFEGAAFADDGTLWLLGRSAGGIPEFVSVGFYKIPDLATGEIVETFSQVFYFLDPEAGVLGLALAPRIDVVDVPALGAWGLAALAGLLGLLGLRRLRPSAYFRRGR